MGHSRITERRDFSLPETECDCVPWERCEHLPPELIEEVTPEQWLFLKSIQSEKV